MASARSDILTNTPFGVTPFWDRTGGNAELIALAECLAGERDDRHRDASAVVDRIDTYLRSIEQRLHAAELERAAEERAEEAGRGLRSSGHAGGGRWRWRRPCWR